MFANNNNNNKAHACLVYVPQLFNCLFFLLTCGLTHTSPEEATENQEASLTCSKNMKKSKMVAFYMEMDDRERVASAKLFRMSV